MGKHTRTIRLRLTLIYGGVFLAAGAVLLTVGWLLVRHNVAVQPQSLKATQHELVRQYLASHPHDSPRRARNLIDSLVAASYHAAGNNALGKLPREYIVSLIALGVVSMALAWTLAGRALAPLREITAAARRVSGANLGERIALQGPQDELKELADTFDAMLVRLDQTFASQRHFVANASHELRTPLAIMRTEVDVALADPDADITELRAMGEAVRETIDRGEALVAALLQLARSEAITGHEELVDMVELAAGVVTDLHSRAESMQVQVRTDLQPAVAFGEPALLERILTNTIDNGIRHNRRGGELWVKTRTLEPEPMVEITVSNDGAVIDPAQVESLTEPFRRLTRTAGGFGLGLSIVKSVAEAHGGTIELEARPEGGLTVRVRLPSAAEFQAAALTRAHPLTKS